MIVNLNPTKPILQHYGDACRPALSSSDYIDLEEYILRQILFLTHFINKLWKKQRIWYEFETI